MQKLKMTVKLRNQSIKSNKWDVVHWYLQSCNDITAFWLEKWSGHVFVRKKLINITNVNFIWPRQLINSCEEVTNVNKLKSVNFNTVLSVCLWRIKYLTRLSEEQLPLQFLVKCKSQVQFPEKSSYQNWPWSKKLDSYSVKHNQ